MPPCGTISCRVFLYASPIPEACDGRPPLENCDCRAPGRLGRVRGAALCRSLVVFGFDAAHGRAARQPVRHRTHVDRHLRARISVRGAGGGARRRARSPASGIRERSGAVRVGLRLGCSRSYCHQRSRGGRDKQPRGALRLRPGIARAHRRDRAQLRSRGHSRRQPALVAAADCDRRVRRSQGRAIGVRDR